MPSDDGSDHAQRLAAAVQRARALQSQAAPLPPEARREHLRIGLAAIMEDLPAAEVPALLAALLDGPANPPSAATTADADPRRALGLAEGDPLDPARTAEAAAVLAEFTGGLDDLVWTAWRQAIAPASRLSRPGPLRRTIAQFLRGDAAISRQRLAEDARLLRLITAATIAAIGRAGKNYARRHLVRFSPDAIRAATGATGWGSQAKLWAKYEELAGTATEETIEAELMQIIGDAARGLAEGKDPPR